MPEGESQGAGEPDEAEVVGGVVGGDAKLLTEELFGAGQLGGGMPHEALADIEWNLIEQIHIDIGSQ